jgi:hypothetical protein
MATSSEARGLALAKLRSSGLAEADLKILRLDVLEGPAVAKLEDCFKALPSLRINYFHPLTGKPLTPRPKWPAFYRLRYLKGGEAVPGGKKPLRYIQPPDSGVCAYFPTNLDWTKLLSDPTQPLIITEGELKAAKACKEGYPTIGLGGVRSFMSTRLNTLFLPELEEVVWTKRSVFIIYDSDFRTNEHICMAMNALAEQLYQRGAEPHFVPLPDLTPDGGKTGLDDFFIRSKKKDALKDLINDNAEALTLAKPLWEMNQRALYIRDPGLVLLRDTSQKVSPNNFTSHAFSNIAAAEREVRADGSVSLKLMPVASRWMAWPLRAEASRLTYVPGSPQIIPETRAFNTWPGWGVEPKKGDISLFTQLIDHVFMGTSPAEKMWFLRWLAYPLQHPGKKLFTNVLLHGIKQGTGKSLIGYTVGQIYGQNFNEIKQTDLENSFTAWGENKQFILADDITGSDSRKHADILKTLTTQLEMKINIKYVPEFKIPDCINYLFTSNQPDAFFIENNDRRSFIWEVMVDPLPDAFYQRYDWALKHDKEKALARAVFHYLLGLPLGDFNPNAKALTTMAKENMISDVKSDLGAWVAQLRSDPSSVLRVGKVPVVGDLFTAHELLRYYDPTGGRTATANGLGRELRRSGVPLFRDGITLRTKRGVHRYFVVRNEGRWARATPAQATKHIDSIT